MQNKLFSLLACFILSTLMVFADGPFRNHRYDGFKAATINSRSIVFIGNSITNMHDWHSAFANHNVVNRGVSGGYATEILANLESYIAGKPAKVFLMIGTNDMAPNGLAHTPEQIAGNIRKIVDRIQNVSPATAIHLTSIFPSTSGGRSLQKIQEANALIAELATEKGLVFIDLYEDLLGITNNTHSRDYLHLSMSGYRIWCNKVAEYVGSECVYPADATNQYPLNNATYNMRASCWAATPVVADDVLMIGDEMISSGEWHEMLNCGNVKNYGTSWGYPGPPLATTLASLPAIFEGRTESVDPKQVFLYAGVADVNGSTALDDVKTSYQNVVEKIRELAPTTRINLMSLQPTGVATINTDRVEPFNAWMQTLAEGMENAAYVDIYTDFENESGVGDSKYFQGNYIYGLGYAKVASILAPLIEGASAMTETEAEEQINLLNARNTLGQAINNLYDIPFGTAAGQYPEAQKTVVEEAITNAYAVLNTENVSITQLNEGVTAINEAVNTLKSSINQPTESTDEAPVYYRIFTPLRGNRQMTSQGLGETVMGEEQHSYINGAWKFVKREDNTWNIINAHDNGYLAYAGTTNNANIQVVADEPSYGWTLSSAANVGMYIITQGTNQLNQTNNSLDYKLVNWGGGTNTTDVGCQFELEIIESPLPPPTLPTPLLDMQHITLSGTAPIRIADATANPVLNHKGSSTIVIDFTSAAQNTAKQTLIGSSSSSVNNRFFTAAVWGSSYSLVYRTEGADGGDQLFTNAIGTATDRHKIIYTIDNEAQTIKYYLDGVLKATYDYASHSAWRIASLGNLPGVDGLYLGGVVTASESNKNPFTGKIHSVRVYPEALNAAQMELIEYVEPQANILPFTPTTITADGEFAADTQWYVMQMTASAYYVKDNGDADRIELSNRTYGSDDEYWCFVGDDANGYRIYNKQGGTKKVLASSSTMLGDAGSETYPTLQPVDALPDGYVDTWDFSASANVEAYTNGQYITMHGHPGKTLNNRGGVLAFWTGGKDAGSTFGISQPVAEATCTVDLAHGTFTAGNSDGSWYKTWSSTEMTGLTFGTSNNNMKPDADDANLISCYRGSATCTYTLSAPAGYVIESLSFDYKLRSDNASANVTVNGTAATTEAKTISVTGHNQRYFTFEEGGSNNGITLSNFTVHIVKQIIPKEEEFEVFRSPYNGVVHRIPAIAQANNGDIIAVADYRYSGEDIGMATNGKLDLHFRISSDNGKSWGEIGTLVAGQGEDAVTPENPNNMWVAFGDPCLVVDRESGEVLAMSCAGNVSFPNGTYDNHQYIVTMRSTNNGQTWTDPVDVADHIYPQFLNSASGSPRAMFVGSGKISQSRYIKVGSHYRIYCSVLYKDVNGTNKNFVLYSDDFGKEWKVLGGVDVAPIPSGADEPKADELPDGSVVVSSRISGGRKYNIFRYTDPLRAEGSWGTVATSSSANNGVIAENNSTNGEILTVPVKRKADGKKMYLFLQSVPFGPNRANVGIYYKALESLADFNTPADLAKDWDGRYQACYFSSAYSTMVWLKNNTLAFLYEEDNHGAAYSIIYKNYTIETLTDNAYEYCADVDEGAFLKADMDTRMAEVESHMGNYVGNLTNVGYLSITEAYETFMANPDKANYIAFNNAVESATYRTLEPGREYRAHNKLYDAYLTITSGSVKTQVLDEANAAQKITFSAGSVAGTWKIKGSDAYLGNPGANETASIATQAMAEEASDYNVVSSREGLTYFACLTPANASWPALHAKGTNNNVVRWNTGADASLWYVEPVDLSAAELIGGIIIDCKKELALAGKVGYPAADNAAAGTFKEAYDAAFAAVKDGTATDDIYNTLVSARDAYKGTTTVVMPEDGKAYTITSVQPENDLYFYMDEAGLKFSSEARNTSDAVFICKKVGEKYVFVNAKYGYYLVHKSNSGGYNENNGYTGTYLESACTFRLHSGNGISHAKAFGSMAIVGNTTGTGTGRSFAPFTINTTGGMNKYSAYDGATPTLQINSTWSTVERIEEVADYKYNTPKLQTKDGKAYATLFLPYATTIPTDVEAYYAAEPVDGTVAMTKIEAATLPKNTPVVLVSETAGEKSFVPAIEAGTAVTENTLYGTMDADEEVGAGYKVYALTGKYDRIGFHIFLGATYSPAKAYLRVPESSAQGFVMNFGGETTGLEGVMNGAAADKAVYDLSGRRVENPGKGLYIINGKKVYIK